MIGRGNIKTKQKKIKYKVLLISKLQSNQNCQNKRKLPVNIIVKVSTL